MSQNAVASTFGSDLAERFLASQRVMYYDYRKTHKLEAKDVEKYVNNVKLIAGYMRDGFMPRQIFGKPVDGYYDAYIVVLGKVGAKIKRVYYAVKF